MPGLKLLDVMYRAVSYNMCVNLVTHCFALLRHFLAPQNNRHLTSASIHLLAIYSFDHDLKQTSTLRLQLQRNRNERR